MAKKQSIIDEICIAPKGSGGWFGQLSPEDQKTALEVRARVQKEGLQVYPVARNLIDALGLKVGDKPVAVWLGKKVSK